MKTLSKKTSKFKGETLKRRLQFIYGRLLDFSFLNH